jgi:hypothetical protein
LADVLEQPLLNDSSRQSSAYRLRITNADLNRNSRSSTRDLKKGALCIDQAIAESPDDQPQEFDGSSSTI